MSLIALPVAAWFFDETSHDHERALVAVLDTVAVEHKMLRLKHD
jgi:hypothetical protein